MDRKSNRLHRIGAPLAASLRPIRGLREVGQIIGLSPQRVLQIEYEALAKIALRLRAGVNESLPG